jgi:HEAT repeat protein
MPTLVSRAVLVVLILASSTLAAQPAIKTSGDKSADDNSSGSLLTPPNKVGDKTLDDWIKLIPADDPSTRTKAILASLEFGDASSKAIPAYLNRLHDGDISPRVKAVFALRAVPLVKKEDEKNDRKKKEVAKKITVALCARLRAAEGREPATPVRYEILQTLARFGEEEGETMVPALVDSSHDIGSWEIRLMAVQMLAQVARKAAKTGDDPNSRQIINKATDAFLARMGATGISESAHEVKLAAVCALGSLGRPDSSHFQRVFEALTAATHTSNRTYAIWAYAGLVAMDDTNNSGKNPALNQIAMFLSPANSHSLELRCVAAQALGALGERAKPRFVQLLSYVNEKEDPAMVGSVTAALCQIDPKSERALPALLELLKSDKKHILVACGAIAFVARDKPSVAEEFIPLLSHKDVEVIAAACTTIAQIGHLNPKVIEELGKLHATNEAKGRAGSDEESQKARGLAELFKETLDVVKQPKPKAK